MPVVGEKVAKILKVAHPNPKTELLHANEYELCVSVMLSAQTTDKKPNLAQRAFARILPGEHH